MGPMLNSTLRYSLCCRFCQHLHQRSIHVYCFQYGIATKQQSKHVKIACKLWHGALNPFASRSDISKHFGNFYQIFKNYPHQFFTSIGSPFLLRSWGAPIRRSMVKAFFWKLLPGSMAESWTAIISTIYLCHWWGAGRCGFCGSSLFSQQNHGLKFSHGNLIMVVLCFNRSVFKVPLN